MRHFKQLVACLPCCSADALLVIPAYQSQKLSWRSHWQSRDQPLPRDLLTSPPMHGTRRPLSGVGNMAW